MTMLTTINGMDRHTGKWLTGLDHLRQSIDDILTTPLGSRICNRDYGSNLPDLVDAPLNEAGIQSLYAATAIAIASHYPFFTLSRIALEADPESPGTVTILLEGHETGSDGQSNALSMALPLSLTAPIFQNQNFQS